MKIKKNYRWKNVAKDHRPRVKKYFLPTKLEDLIQIVKEAEANNMKVRAVGSGHSYSTVAVGSDYVVDLKNVNLVLPIKKKWLLDKQPLMFDDGQLLEIEAGISIQWLNKQLERKKLALINMGAVDDQTMAGAIATGTHGTGWNLPATPGMVRSITMVAHQGKVYKIEPKSKPVTNPATYDHPTIELIQDDDIFNSALLGLGCMGLIYSYIIEVRKEYWLKETKTPAFWADVKPKLEDLSLFEKNEKGEQVYRGISVLVNPYPNVKDKDHRCLIIRHRELDEKEKRSISASLPNLLGRIGGTLPIGYWIALQTLYDKPHKMPKLIDSAMGSIKDKEYIHKSHKVLHQGAELIKNKALSSEFAIPIKDPVRDFVTVTEALIKKSAALAREGMYISSPLSLRFVDRSDAYLALENQGRACYIDVPLLKKTPNRARILNEYQDLVFRMGGFPHWGKINNQLVNFKETIPGKFPNLHLWEKTMRKFNPIGTFDNVFSEKLDLGNITGGGGPIA